MGPHRADAFVDALARVDGRPEELADLCARSVQPSDVDFMRPVSNSIGRQMCSQPPSASRWPGRSSSCNRWPITIRRTPRETPRVGIVASHHSMRAVRSAWLLAWAAFKKSSATSTSGCSPVPSPPTDVAIRQPRASLSNRIFWFWSPTMRNTWPQLRLVPVALQQRAALPRIARGELLVVADEHPPRLGPVPRAPGPHGQKDGRQQALHAAGGHVHEKLLDSARRGPLRDARTGPGCASCRRRGRRSPNGARPAARIRAGSSRAFRSRHDCAAAGLPLAGQLVALVDRLEPAPRRPRLAAGFLLSRSTCLDACTNTARSTAVHFRRRLRALRANSATLRRVGNRCPLSRPNRRGRTTRIELARAEEAPTLGGKSRDEVSGRAPRTAPIPRPRALNTTDAARRVEDFA